MSVRQSLDRLLTAASIIFLIAYAIPIIWPTANAQLIEFCKVTQLLVWAFFGVDLAARFSMSATKWQFFKSNWFDVLAVTLPALRPLRILRVLSFGLLASRRLGPAASFRITIATRATFLTIMLWFLAGLAITDAERTGGGNIQGVVDGWWWALTTMTTVGYGDYSPVTAEGRLIAAGVMLLGITILGLTTASIASWFVEKTAQAELHIAEEQIGMTELQSELRSLRTEIKDLRNQIERKEP